MTIYGFKVPASVLKSAWDFMSKKESFTHSDLMRQIKTDLAFPRWSDGLRHQHIIRRIADNLCQQERKRGNIRYDKQTKTWHLDGPIRQEQKQLDLKWPKTTLEDEVQGQVILDHLKSIELPGSGEIYIQTVRRSDGVVVSEQVQRNFHTAMTAPVTSENIELALYLVSKKPSTKNYYGRVVVRKTIDFVVG